MYCPECGKELREGARFCPKCGKKVKEIPENIRKATSPRKRNHFLLIVTLFVIIFFSSIGIAGKVLLDKNKYENVSEEAFNDYITYDDHFLEIEAKYLNENGYVNSEDVIQLLEEIESAIHQGMDRGIIKSYSKENKNIHIQFTSGIQYIFIPYEEGTLSNGTGGKIMTIQPVKDSYGVRLTNFLTFIDKLYNKLDYMGSYLPDENANMIKKAFDNRYDFNTLAFDPYSFKPEFAFSNEDVTIDAMKKLNQYKIIIFEGHGGYTSEVHSALVTGETFLGFQEFSRYKDDIKSGNIILSSFPTIGESNAVYSPVRNFCVTSKFFDTYLGEFDDSLIFLGACFSAKDKVLAQSLINKGASVVLGYSESTSMEYEMMTRTMFFYSMTCTYEGEYLTVEQALNYAKNQIGWKDPWGGKNAELVCLSKDSLEKVYTLDGIRQDIESDDKLVVPITEPDTDQDTSDVLEDDESGTMGKSTSFVEGENFKRILTSDNDISQRTIGNVIFSWESNYDKERGTYGTIYVTQNGKTTPFVTEKNLNAYIVTNGTDVFYSTQDSGSEAVVYKKQLTDDTTGDRLFSTSVDTSFSLAGYYDSKLYYIKELDPGMFYEYSFTTQGHSLLAENVTHVTQKNKYFYLEPYYGDAGGTSSLRCFDADNGKTTVISDNLCILGRWEILGNFIYYMEYTDSKDYHSGPVQIMVSRCKMDGSKKEILISELEMTSMISITSEGVTYLDKNGNIRTMTFGEAEDNLSDHDSYTSENSDNTLQDLNSFNIDGYWYSDDLQYVCRIYTDKMDNGFNTLAYTVLGDGHIKHGTIQQTSSYSVILKPREDREKAYEVFAKNQQLTSDEITLTRVSDSVVNHILGSWGNEDETYTFGDEGTYKVYSSGNSYWGYFFVIDENKIVLGKASDNLKLFDYSINGDTLKIGNRTPLVRQ